MKRITIDLPTQTLRLHDGDQTTHRWLVSTAAKGGGERINSYQTPRGRHIIRAKIGAGAATGTVFRGRRPTGEIYSPALAEQYPPDRDWILTRVLWLSGCEVGKNRLGKVDTMRRYIYIHGTPHADVLGTPGSCGCVRMANDAVVTLFNLTPIGTVVDIAG